MEAPARFDRYEVLAPLGVGGMGEVVKARAVGPHGFEKLVAIKRIKAEWAQQEAMAGRFIREAQIAARLQHANIVQVFDFGRHGDELFLVMELVDGQSLDDILASLAEKGKRPTLAQTLQIVLDVSRALESAHGLRDEQSEVTGIVHRDVSPANVMISRQGVVKLTDFGIAAWAKHQARTSLVAGKPLYMAPEQLRGDPLDGRADLFAVGLLMYEMITGQRPWKGMVDPSPDATLESHDYSPPSTYATEVPEDIDELVGRLLQPDRDKRPGTAGEVARALVEVSYKCQIVLDPGELRPLVGEGTADAHAPTQASNPSRPETLIAAGVNPDGSTMLARATPVPGTTERVAPRRPAAWMIAAAALFVVGGVGFAWAAMNPGDPAMTAAHVTTEPAAPEPPPEDPAGETEPETEPLPEGSDPPVVVDEPLDSDATEPTEEEATDPSRVDEPTPEDDAASVEEPGARPGRRRRTSPDREEPSGPTAASGPPGTIDIFARPWAEIYIDGEQYAHNAPRPNVPIPAGRHQIRLVNPVLGTTRTRTVTIPPGGHQRIVMPMSGEE